MKQKNNLNSLFFKSLIKILLCICILWIILLMYVYIDKIGLLMGYDAFILQKNISKVLNSQQNYMNLADYTNFNWSKVCIKNVFEENEQTYTYDFSYTEFSFDKKIIRIKSGTFCNNDNAVADATYCYNNSSAKIAISICKDNNGKYYRYLDIGK